MCGTSHQPAPLICRPHRGSIPALLATPFWPPCAVIPGDSVQKQLTALLILALMACGSSKVTAPSVPVVTGTVAFALTNCQAYQSAEYVVDGTSVGIEQMVAGSLSKAYTVAAGRRNTIARVVKTGAINGLWTFRATVTVPEHGSVTATLVC